MPRPVVTIADGRVIKRRHEWSDVAPNELALVTRAVDMVKAIASRCGAGRIWILGPGIVHIVNDDGRSVLLNDDGMPACRLRAIYCHEAEAK